MTTTTKNYNFILPSLSDSPPDITVTNTNWETVDNKLKDHESQISESSSIINNLSDEINNLDASKIDLTTSTASLYALNGTNANVDKALQKALVDYSSYRAFCANANTDSLDCAFGKNNEEYLIRLGLQLFMYEKFKAGVVNSSNFLNLINCNTLHEIASDYKALYELRSSSYIFSLVSSNTYANSIISNLTDTVKVDYIYYATGINKDVYPTLASITSNSAAFNSLLANSYNFSLALDFVAFRQAIVNNSSITESILAASTAANNAINNHPSTVSVSLGSVKTTSWRYAYDSTIPTYCSQAAYDGGDSNGSYREVTVTYKNGTVSTAANVTIAGRMIKQCGVRNTSTGSSVGGGSMSIKYLGV